ncbi:hypothetical protein VB715_10610 [Crocosphaera sp. UHCC 0190]|uniref:hypothetical protein n=1 Tax=Crocosphaera sp. UHCC 0190 TaxID=3110246 RepID=UPI002B204A6C|nr:hypothetical protein [Crocosphaera sp. UHCC 0190]MEA5510213.1 hypothetical protein [Crocosphaera sp. UHCC 0190]
MITYSLFSRFQGSLFGNLIGETLINRERSQFWWRIMSKKVMIKLIEKGEIMSEDWVVISPEKPSLSSGELILGILPLSLLFYDTPYQFQQQLNPLINLWDIPSETVKEIVFFNDLLGKILNEKLAKNTPVNLLEITDKVPLSWESSLQKIQEFLDKGTPLTEVNRYFRQQTSPEKTVIPLSLYCFNRTPNNFRLSVLQAVQTGCLLISTLTGTLSGAYNSVLGIPVPWRLAQQIDPDPPLSYQQIFTLWERWAGVDKVAQGETIGDKTAVSSPGVMQQRPPLMLISQKEYLQPTPIEGEND